MKRNELLLLSLSMVMMIFSAFTVNSEREETTNRKIALVRSSGGHRSSTAAEVEAFISNNQTLTVDIKNYTDTVCVGVTGVGGTLQETVQVYDNALIVIDLSTLPHGDYLLTITLGNELYEGYFEY